LSVFFINWRKLRDSGMHRIRGRDWLYAVPGAVVASLAGGAWFPGALSPGPHLLNAPGLYVFSVLLLAAASELLFRGTVHDLLARVYATQKIGGRWYLSWPVLISTAAYAFWALVPFRTFSVVWGIKTAAAVCIFGACCGVARERSGSLLAPLLIHCGCMLIPVMAL
jgi:hypothetical protein